MVLNLNMITVKGKREKKKRVKKPINLFLFFELLNKFKKRSHFPSLDIYYYCLFLKAVLIYLFLFFQITHLLYI